MFERPEKTDISGVIKVAEDLMDYKPTEGTKPGIISHPYARRRTIEYKTKAPSNIVDVDDEPWITGDIFNNEDYAKWKTFMLANIHQTLDAHDIMFSLLQKPYWWLYFLCVNPYLSLEDAKEIYRNCWIACGYPTDNKLLSKANFIDLFHELADGPFVDEDDEDDFDCLPEVLTIYRGVKKNTEKAIRGMSWSLDEEIAYFFASRVDGKGFIYTATIDKDKILAYLPTEEQEIVVDPSTMRDIQLLREVNDPAGKYTLHPADDEDEYDDDSDNFE